MKDDNQITHLIAETLARFVKVEARLQNLETFAAATGEMLTDDTFLPIANAFETIEKRLGKLERLTDEAFLPIATAFETNNERLEDLEN